VPADAQRAHHDELDAGTKRGCPTPEHHSSLYGDAARRPTSRTCTEIGCAGGRSRPGSRRHVDGGVSGAMSVPTARWPETTAGPVRPEPAVTAAPIPRRRRRQSPGSANGVAQERLRQGRGVGPDEASWARHTAPVAAPEHGAGPGGGVRLYSPVALASREGRVVALEDLLAMRRAAGPRGRRRVGGTASRGGRAGPMRWASVVRKSVGNAS
jgi:hypothetical protein